MSRHYNELRNERWHQGKFVSMGLDPVIEQLPGHLWRLPDRDRLVRFCCELIEANSDVVGCFKPNIAFFEPFGAEGFRALRTIMEHARVVAPNVPMVGDIKRADIGDTNKGYAWAAFEHFGFDAITVHPYLGSPAMKPFLEREDKGVIVLCRTSNPGSDQFQTVPVLVEETRARVLMPSTPLNELCDQMGWQRVLNHVVMPMYHKVALEVARQWDDNHNCSLVMGATYPEELKLVRQLVPYMSFLIPGIGKQGGDLEQSVLNGRTGELSGMFINSSSKIIYASNGEDYATAARKAAVDLHNEILAIMARHDGNDYENFNIAA